VCALKVLEGLALLLIFASQKLARLAVVEPALRINHSLACGFMIIFGADID